MRPSYPFCFPVSPSMISESKPCTRDTLWAESPKERAMGPLGSTGDPSVFRVFTV